MNRGRRLQSDNKPPRHFEQLGIFSAPTVTLVVPEYRKGDSIQRRFEQFHKENPHVATWLRGMAMALKRRGIQRYGMKALFEAIRFDSALKTGADDFKLNNNYTALYARLLMRIEPELQGFFELRTRKKEEA